MIFSMSFSDSMNDFHQD